MAETMQKGARALVPGIDINSWSTNEDVLAKLLGCGAYMAAYAEVVAQMSSIKAGPLAGVWAEARLDGAESSECARLALALMALAHALSGAETAQMVLDAADMAGGDDDYDDIEL